MTDNKKEMVTSLQYLVEMIDNAPFELSIEQDMQLLKAKTLLLKESLEHAD